jgi:putative inorganic carbon (HCO3(-)) transporter
MDAVRDKAATFLLFIFAVGAPLSTGVGNIATGAFLILAFFWAVRSRPKRGWPPRYIVLALLALLAINALATATAGPLPVRWGKFLEELWHKPLLLAIPLLAWAVPRRVEQAVKLMVIVGSVVAIYAIFQHFTGQDLVRGREIYTSTGRYVAYGFFDHHLTYGGHVMLLLLFAIAWALLAPRTRRLPPWPLAVCIGLLGLALLWSYARSAQLGTLIGVLFLISRLPKGQRRWAGLVLLVAIVCAVAIPTVRHRLGQVFTPGSTETRVNLWQSSQDAIAARPWLGFGRGNFNEMMELHGVEGFYDTQAHSHNDFLMQGVMAGIPGLLAFVALVVGVAVCLWRVRKKVGRFAWIVLGGVAIQLGISAAGFFQVYQTDDEVEMVLYFLLGCCLAVAVSPPDKGGDRSPPSLNGNENMPRS